MADPNTPTFAFKIKGYDGALRVPAFTGHEAISELFSFSIELAVDDDTIEFSKVVGSAATLTLFSPDHQRDIDGIVSRLEQRGTDAWHSSYRVEFVPTVWPLTQQFDCRIFQDKTVMEIIKDVFEFAGLSAEVSTKVRGSFPKRTYCVQYRESNWDFVSRLMEEEGIFYFFQSSDKGTKLVLANTPEEHADIDGNIDIPYRPPSGLVDVPEWIHDVSLAQRVRSGRVTLGDHNFETPSLSLRKQKTSEANAGGNTKLEIYDYPGLYEKDDNGQRLAEIRLQEVLTSGKELIAQSQCRRLASGHRFILKEAPRKNFDGKYVITRIEHDGQQPLGENDPSSGFRYVNNFRAIPSDVPFRPARLTPKPFVEGVQTAVVTGPGGEEIYTDKYGRVKVQFPWDRNGKLDEKTSCWIRVAQLWAGQGWGAMFIPRIGQEVIVDFIEGDPDRPIITGRVYNAANMPPYALDGEKTKSTIKSNSSKGGKGFNEYRFEDKKGSEEIYQHAQLNLTIVTNNDKNQSTGHDETLKIDHDRSKEVKHDETTKVGNNRTEDVGSDEKITIGKNRTEQVGLNETIKIGANRTEEVATNEDIKIGASRSESVGANESVTIGASRKVSVGANEQVDIGGESAITVGKAMSLTIGGDQSVTVSGESSSKSEGDMSMETEGDYACKAGGEAEIEAEDEISIKCGSASIVLKSDGTINIKGKDIKLDGSGAINIKASNNVVIKGQKILQN